MLEAYARVAKAIGDRPWFRPISRGLVPVLDKVLVPLGLRSTPWPTLVLATIGRKSGEERKAPLFYVEVDGGVAVPATNYGGAEPNWSKNLRANPRCQVTLDRQTTHRIARPAAEEDEDAIFQRFADFYPVYDVYRERAGRDIPIWILEPAPSG